MVKALAHCHAQNVYHRDIKPENLMVKPDDTIKVVDFGLSIQQNAASTAIEPRTPFYMAPEILDGKQFAASADVWSLGVLLYIFLSGYMPYTAKSQ